MAEIVTVKLVAETGDAVKNVEKVEKAVEKTEKTTKKASKELSAMQQIGNETVKGLDRLTGGLASKFVAVGKAAKLSGKAMKTALISSGIGLAVAAVGLLVEYWDEIGEALGFINKDLERQVELNNQNLDAVGVRLRNIQTLIELRKREGKDVDLLLKKEKELTEQKKQAFITSIQDQALLVNRLKLKQQEGKLNEEDTKELQKQEGVYLDIINSFNKFKSDLLEPVKEVVKKDTSEEDAKKAANEATKIAEAAEKARLEAIERIRKGLIDTEAEERAEKLRLIKEDYNQQIALAAEFYGANSIKILELKAAQKLAEDEQQAKFDLQDKDRKDKKDKDDADAKDLRNKTIADDLAEQARIDKEAAEHKENEYQETYGNLQTIVGAGGKKLEKVGKALAIADIARTSYKSISATVSSTGEANAAATAASPLTGGMPFVAINTVKAALSIGATLASAKKSISAITSNSKNPSGSSPSPSGGGGGGGGAQPPAFNVVGASGETQLADAIGGQTQRPSRAYVVSNDVTTAQEMDRNIIEGASI